MHAFAISIPRFHDRYAYIRRHMAERFGDDFEVIGVDGLAVGDEEIAQPVLTRGQVGCALSHVAAYRRMAELDLPWALVVEDDVVLPERIREIAEAAGRLLADGEVILLFNWAREEARFSRLHAARILGYGVYYPVDVEGLGSTVAYVISRRAAEGIARVNRPVETVADGWSHFHRRGAFFSARIVHPSPVRLKGFASTVFARPGAGRPAFLARLAAAPVLRRLLAARRRLLARSGGRRVVLVDEPSPFDGAAHA